MSKGRIIVGMSGGVDSSVAALILRREGYEVEGLFMKNWEEDDTSGYCAAARDLEDARSAAERLGMNLHTVNFATEYWDRVFERFLYEYRAGRTPNPDVLCNREIKFGAFLDHALSLGADLIATGHYARVARSSDGMHLQTGIDDSKDQSYFLYLLDQRQLSRSLFPLGGLLKSEVRSLARNAGFENHDKKDSTGICFIGERRFRDFLSRYLPPNPGPIESAEGRLLGTHRGLMYYTVGQRQGLGIGGLAGEKEAPWFIAAKDARRNTLIAVQGHEHPALYSSGLFATQLHWVLGRGPESIPLYCHARIRYRQARQPCEITALGDNRCTVRFSAPQRAVTPGQSVVFYRGDDCLGGGIIDDVFPRPFENLH